MMWSDDYFSAPALRPEIINPPRLNINLGHDSKNFYNCFSYEDTQHNMVPNLAPQTSATIAGPLPPLTRSATLPVNPRHNATDRSLLTPEDAIYQGSPPRKQSVAVNRLPKDIRVANGSNGEARASRRRLKDRNRSGSRRPKTTWKKLLWVKQSCEIFH